MTRALGLVVRARRRELGLTQEQFAELLGEGVRQSEVSRLERGHVSLPRRERLLRIGEVLDVPVGKLLMLTAWADTGREPGRPPARIEFQPVSAAPRPQGPQGQRRPIDEIICNARATMERTREILDSLNGTERVSSGARD